tara:strand:- start:2122 stop:2676 length:555 start_codon:yes stop_codon:yes gene_type:complete
MNLVLASGSERRRQMLEAAGLNPVVAPVEVDERRIQGTVDAQVLHIAKQKAEAVGENHAGSIVLVADTMLADPDDATLALGQPVDAQGALAMLLRLRGRRHRVWSASGLRVAGTWTFDMASAVVEFSSFDDDVLADLVHSGSWKGKAGAYDFAGAMGPHASLVEGDEATVLGIPGRVLLALSGL